MTLYALFVVVLALALGMLFAPLWRARPSQHFRLFAAIVSLMFIVGSFTLYFMLGSPALVPLMKEREQKLAGLTDNIRQNAAKVKANPKDLAAWVQLGEDFMATGQYAAAANAFKVTVLISGGNPALILAYSEAQIFEADGKVTDAAKKGLEMVAMQQPKNSEARYWLIVRKLQDGDTKNAMQAMKKLYQSLPGDSPLKTMIDAQIGRNN